MNKLRKLIVGVVAGFAGLALVQSASAEVTVGGFMTQTIGFGDWKGGSEAEKELHFDTNAEILFTATAQTDGGLTVTARVELEGHSEAGDHIDENWLSVEGGFGKLTLGGEDPALITHGYAGIAGGYGTMGYYDDTDSFTLVGGRIYPVGYKDAQGIRYSSPSLGGVSVGVSYQPEFQDGPRSTSDDNDDDAMSIAANYSNDMGGVQITVAGGVISYDDSYQEDNQIGAGAEIGFGANKVFVRYDKWNDITKNWGIAYEHSQGSLTVGLGYARQSNNHGDVTVVVPPFEAATVEDLDIQYDAVVLGAKYSLGSGVSAGAALAWGKVTAEGTVNSATEKVDENSTGFGAHVAFSF